MVDPARGRHHRRRDRVPQAGVAGDHERRGAARARRRQPTPEGDRVRARLARRDAVQELPPTDAARAWQQPRVSRRRQRRPAASTAGDDQLAARGDDA